MRKLIQGKNKFRLILASAATVALSAGALSMPAKAADPVTITIWTFGDVIQRNLVAEYKVLHPEVTLQIKKSDLDPLNGTNMVTACSSKTGPDIVATEVSYSGYWRSYPKCFQDLRQMKTTGEPSANIPAGQTANDISKNYLAWRWQQGVDLRLPTALICLRKPGFQQHAMKLASFGQHGINLLKLAKSMFQN
jgi:ABC-type glycerol-3-phosphate transport system substrate-binding protein